MNLVRAVLKKLSKMVKPGATALELEAYMLKILAPYNIQSTSKGVYGFPHHICISVNNQICHAFSGAYKFKEGDLVKIDCIIKQKGKWTDSAVTVGCGKISRLNRKLVKATKLARDRAIQICRPGTSLIEIAQTIENVAKKYNICVIKSLSGHRIGNWIHEQPSVANSVEEAEDYILKEGDVFAIEPLFSISTEKFIEDEGILTADGSNSAHWEHTVEITKNGHRILT